MRPEIKKSTDEVEVRFDLFADVAHELQTPIAILAGNLEMIEHGNEEEKKRAIRVLRTTVAGMSRLTNSLLQAARLQGGQDEYNWGSVNIKELLNEVYEDCMVLAVNSALMLSVDAEEIFIEGDRRKLKEVLLNLISNALRHTAAGGSIRLRAAKAWPTESMKEGGDAGSSAFAKISVEDTGSGIAAEHLAHIFERFYRIETRGSRGTGLGLYLCRQIVEAHKGTVIAESELGKGSAFIVSLPLILL